MFAFVMRLLTASALLLTPVAAYITPPLADDGLVAPEAAAPKPASKYSTTINFCLSEIKASPAPEPSPHPNPIQPKPKPKPSPSSNAEPNPKPNPGPRQASFTALDANGDGALSKEEFDLALGLTPATGSIAPAASTAADLATPPPPPPLAATTSSDAASPAATAAVDAAAASTGV